MNNRIVELRREKGMTQEELAALCEVTRQTIISLEGGRYNPSIFLAYKIARVFGRSIEEVFLFEEDKK
jgi:Predicted transcriptional regulators